MTESPKPVAAPLKGRLLPRSNANNNPVRIVIKARHYVPLFSNMKELKAALDAIGVERHLYHTVTITDERAFVTNMPLCLDIMLDLRVEGAKQQFSVVDRKAFLN